MNRCPETSLVNPNPWKPYTEVTIKRMIPPVLTNLSIGATNRFIQKNLRESDRIGRGILERGSQGKEQETSGYIGQADKRGTMACCPRVITDCYTRNVVGHLTFLCGICSLPLRGKRQVGGGGLFLSMITEPRCVSRSFHYVLRSLLCRCRPISLRQTDRFIRRLPPTSGYPVLFAFCAKISLTHDTVT